MEPKAHSPEYLPPQPPQGELEKGPEQGFEVPEFSPEQQAERVGEQHHATTTAAPIAISLPTPQAPTVDPANDTATMAVDDTPVAAADEDLIEKEWVDKAKKIVADTKDDPHTREREVGKLQADYLRKRYGKELGSS